MTRRLALITGGTSGIGFGIAKKLAPTFDLALVYRADAEKAQTAKNHLNREYPETKVTVFEKPLVDGKTCGELFEAVVKSFDRAPDVLVNSAGGIADGLFLQIEFEKLQNLLNEHLVVTMALSQLALKPMYKAKWGRIINLSSISSGFAKRGQAGYAAAKAGIEGFTKTLALEVAHRGITVNAIAPGLIETAMTKSLLEKIGTDPRGLKDRIPAGRPGTVNEVGSLGAFLASEEAAYITGAVITIDGGRSLGDSLS